MAKRGEASKALGFSLTASFVGGLFSAFCLLLVAPPLARVSLLFGPPEYFSIAILGLTLIGTISEGSWVKGLLAGFIGLLLATVGMDPVTGLPRFTFGSMNLLSGINLVVALIGLFSLSQALIMVEKRGGAIVQTQKIRGRVFPTLSELKKVGVTMLRSSIIGTWIGMLPGTGGDLATWVGYNEAKRVSKDRDKFGTGIPEGIVASEAANNAVTGGSLIPLLALGIPGSSTTAVLLGGFLVHGLRPGPRFMTVYGELSFTIIVALFVANLLILIEGFWAAKLGGYIAKVKDETIAPVVIVLSVVGSYSIGNNLFDVKLMLLFGVIGYFMKKVDFPTAPMVLGLILGPMAESGLRQSLLISQGSWRIFVAKPISLILLVLALFSIISAVKREIKNRKILKEKRYL
jgi:putative tricarboxylic transport membrane protein